jgi:hypothetical protein
MIQPILIFIGFVVLLWALFGESVSSDFGGFGAILIGGALVLIAFGILIHILAGRLEKKNKERTEKEE